MRVKVIQEVSMHAAMATVRREFGSEALILGSQKRGGGVELTVALEMSPDTHDPAPLPPLRQHNRENPLALGTSLHDWHGLDLPELDKATTSEQAVTVIQRRFAFEALDLSREAPPQIVCGPHGGGKTLTVTRLATRLVLSGQRPLVITTDTERSGAFEQLSACTQILGVELRAVEDILELRRLCAHARGERMVLIDTSGLNPWDGHLLKRLAEMRSATDGALTVVQPAGGHTSETQDMMDVLCHIGAKQIIISKTDCTRRLGSIAKLPSNGMVLSEASTGHSILEGLIRLTPHSFHELLVAMHKKAPALAEFDKKFPVRKRNKVEEQAVQSNQSRGLLNMPQYPFVKGAEVLTRHMVAQGRL